MLVRLDLPYADVCAGDLALTLGDAPEPALEVLAVAAGGFEIELRLLGSSHQTIAPGFSEMVSCRPGVTGGLPARSSRKTAAIAYSFEAEVARVIPPVYAVHARTVVDAAADDPNGLVGLFPGPGQAFTALRARAAPGGIAWWTWHGYPQTGELVMTRSVLEHSP